MSPEQLVQAATEAHLGAADEALSLAVLRRLAWRAARGGQRCASCGLEKPTSAFALDGRSSTGLDRRCRACDASRKRASRNPGPLLDQEEK